MAMPFLYQGDAAPLLAKTDPDNAYAESSQIKAQLAEEGAILFRGLGIQSAKAFDRFSYQFGYRDFSYQASLSNAVRINLTPRVFTANEAPKEVEIFLHHEMAQTPLPPDKLFFCCLSASESGGATPLCRSDYVARDLREEHPALFKAFDQRGLKYTTTMPADNDHASGQGRSWQSTLSVRSKAEAEARLTQMGYTFLWQQDDSLVTTTARLPATKQLPNGDVSFFNQVIAVHLGWRNSASGKPNLTFGDGSPIEQKALETIVEVASRHTVDLAWEDGDIALIDNHRMMHGRRPYGGDRPRQVIVTLALDH